MPIFEAILRVLSPIEAIALARACFYTAKTSWEQTVSGLVKQKVTHCILRELRIELGDVVGEFIFQEISKPDAQLVLTGGFLTRVLLQEKWEKQDVDLVAPLTFGTENSLIPLRVRTENSLHSLGGDLYWAFKSALVSICNENQIGFRLRFREQSSYQHNVILNEFVINSNSLIQIIVPCDLTVTQHIESFDLEFCKNTYCKGKLHVPHISSLITKKSSMNVDSYLLHHIPVQFGITHEEAITFSIYCQLNDRMKKYRGRGFDINVEKTVESDLLQQFMENWHRKVYTLRNCESSPYEYRTITDAGEVTKFFKLLISQWNKLFV